MERRRVQGVGRAGAMHQCVSSLGRAWHRLCLRCVPCRADCIRRGAVSCCCIAHHRLCLLGGTADPSIGANVYTFMVQNTQPLAARHMHSVAAQAAPVTAPLTSLLGSAGLLPLLGCAALRPRPLALRLGPRDAVLPSSAARCLCSGFALRNRVFFFAPGSLASLGLCWGSLRLCRRAARVARLCSTRAFVAALLTPATSCFTMGSSSACLCIASVLQGSSPKTRPSRCRACLCIRPLIAIRGARTLVGHRAGEAHCGGACIGQGGRRGSLPAGRLQGVVAAVHGVHLMDSEHACSRRVDDAS